MEITSKETEVSIRLCGGLVDVFGPLQVVLQFNAEVGIVKRVSRMILFMVYVHFLLTFLELMCRIYHLFSLKRLCYEEAQLQRRSRSLWKTSEESEESQILR